MFQGTNLAYLLYLLLIVRFPVVIWARRWVPRVPEGATQPSAPTLLAGSVLLSVQSTTRLSCCPESFLAFLLCSRLFHLALLPPHPHSRLAPVRPVPSVFPAMSPSGKAPLARVA